MPVDKYQLEDFRRIASTDPTKLQAVVDRLRELKPNPISTGRLFAAAKEALPDEQAADGLIRQALFQFSHIIRGGASVEKVLENVREMLLNEPDWNKQEQVKWSGVEAIFGDLLSLDTVRLVAAAIDLSYEYVNVYKAARILTDIRPIFNNDATGIEGAVISHALHIQFQNLDGPHELAIVLDESDVYDLLELCERALTKADTAGSFMRDIGKMPTMIPGRPDDA